MATFLFDEIIFGPVRSRRLGSSLGINLLPVSRKLCNFNCIYCECGITPHSGSYDKVPSKEEVVREMETKITAFEKAGTRIDALTFAGNGEPTLHPDFPGIIDGTVRIRNEKMPHVEIVVLSNATRLHIPEIMESLKRVDKPILKLDSAFEDTINKINCPRADFSIEEVMKNLEKLKGKFILQTLFLRGEYKGEYIDNASAVEVQAWLNAVEHLQPREVMIYTIARDTPLDTLEKIPEEELRKIAIQVEKIGISTQVSA